MVTFIVTEMVLILFLLTRPCSMQLHPTFMVEAERYGCFGFSYVPESFELSHCFFVVCMHLDTETVLIANLDAYESGNCLIFLQEVLNRMILFCKAAVEVTF